MTTATTNSTGPLPITKHVMTKTDIADPPPDPPDRPTHLLKKKPTRNDALEKPAPLVPTKMIDLTIAL